MRISFQSTASRAVRSARTPGARTWGHGTTHAVDPVSADGTHPTFLRRTGLPTIPPRSATPALPSFSIAPAVAPEEARARSAGERVRTEPAPASPLTTATEVGSGASPGALTTGGRAYFEPLVGGDLANARLHVDSRAASLTRLAGAEALTAGSDIFIPPDRFAPESAEGRSLLGHELAHVAHDAPRGAATAFRKEKTEPHYPTPDEQKEIEKILGRDLAVQAPDPTTEPESPDEEKPAEQRGRALTGPERRDLAASIQDDFYTTLRSLSGGSATPDADALDKDEAYDAVQDARDAIYKKFGSYAYREITMTRDATTTVEGRKASNQVLATFEGTENMARALARTIVETNCAKCREAVADLDDESRRAVKGIVVSIAMRDRGEDLKKAAARRVGGHYSRDEELLNVKLTTREELYATAVHELIHALAHPVFYAAFIDERVLIEGFTEYFTKQIVNEDQTEYKDVVASVEAVKAAMKGPFSTGRFTAPAEESLRAAYFQGKLEMIGWVPTGPDEEAAVEEAGGAPKWDREKGASYVEKYREAARKAQAPSWNVLGVGLYFTPEASDSSAFSVRYARVLTRTKPYARGQFYAEGQIWGAPVQNPASLAASLGLGAEYQEPAFYLDAGARFRGDIIAPEGDSKRIDIAPFVGGGIRAWQTVRVGAEGFVLLPLNDQGVQYGAGLTVGVEFK